MSAKTKQNGESSDAEPSMYNQWALRSNGVVVEYCRTSMSALGGCTAGILGLTSFEGFLFCLLCNFTLWLLLLEKAGKNWQQYFISRKALLTSGLFSGVMTFVLFWVFLYGMVHVY